MLHNSRFYEVHYSHPVVISNGVPRHEDVWGSGSIAPRILSLGSRWRWVVIFTPGPLYTLNRRLVVLRSRSGRCNEE